MSTRALNRRVEKVAKRAGLCPVCGRAAGGISRDVTAMSDAELEAEIERLQQEEWQSLLAVATPREAEAAERLIAEVEGLRATLKRRLSAGRGQRA